MHRVIELELWSKPGSALLPQTGKSVAIACRRETGLSEQVVLGLNFVPDAADMRNLQLSLTEGEFCQAEFEQFCATRGLSADTNDNISAAEFLAHAVGQPLAWLHLPESREGLHMAHLVLGWAEKSGYLLRVGQSEPPLRTEELSCLWPS